MVTKQKENEELKSKIQDIAGRGTVIRLEKELTEKITPISVGAKELTWDKNKYLTTPEKEKVRRDSEKMVSKIKHEYWEEMLKPKHVVGQTIRKDLVGKKAPFEKSIEDAEKMILAYRSMVATRGYLESIGLQPVVKSIGGKQIGGYTHSVFRDLTIEEIQTVTSGWKEGKDFQEIAKNLNKKSSFHPMNEKMIIAITRAIVISGVPEGKSEGVDAVVNAVVNHRELSGEEREKLKLSDLEYKGIKNSVEIMLARNTLEASLEFFQKSYPGIKLGERGVSVGDDLLKIAPEYIRKILKENNSVALAFKLEDGRGAVKRFNLDGDGVPYTDADGRGREISTSGRMAAVAFMEPWEVTPFRVMFFEHMVPSSKDVEIDGMKSRDGNRLWDKLKEKDKLGLTDKDSFVIFVTGREFANDAVDRFRERMQNAQERGGLALADYVKNQVSSGKTVESVKKDVHPFIQREVELTAMILNARLEGEKVDDEK